MKFATIIAILFCLNSYGQTFYSESSEVSFFSSAHLENISAVNRNGSGIYNAESYQVAFLIPIKGFQFRKSLMQRHFNERFMDSEKYPHATFEGKLVEMDPKLFGEQQVRAIGELTIHGISRQVEIKGKLINLGERLQMEAEFPVRLEDYNISIPKILFQNIAEVVDVKASFHFVQNE